MKTDIKNVELEIGQTIKEIYLENYGYVNGKITYIGGEYVVIDDEHQIDIDEVEVEIDVRNLAEQLGLEVIETTTGTNGYPQNIKPAIVGFESFEQAADLADRYGLNVESFRKRDGWQLWNRDNATMFKPYQNSASKYGDNYTDFSKMDEDDFIENEVLPFLENFSDFESLNRFISIEKEIWEEIDKMEDDEIVIVQEGNYLETIKEESMEFSHDTWNYIIGII